MSRIDLYIYIYIVMLYYEQTWQNLAQRLCPELIPYRDRVSDPGLRSWFGPPLPLARMREQP